VTTDQTTRVPAVHQPEGVRPDYFAVPDPLDPDRLSYWYRPKRGRKAGKIQPWPPRRNRWGVLLGSEVLTVPVDQRDEYRIGHWRRVREARQMVAAAIDTDPGLCAARFSAARSACCVCGKELTDERSKTYGIGPDCRQGIGPEALAGLVNAMAAAHAEGRLSWRRNRHDDPELFGRSRPERT
jgi:Family of unknown function (DUF6011)